MRDPARINEVLEALRAAWQLDPDLRLGQLIVNAARPASPCPEVFFVKAQGLPTGKSLVEDDKLAEGLSRYVKARRSAQSKP